MEFKNLILQLDQGILTITINRVEKMNALNDETVQEISAAVDRIYNDEAVKGAIIVGAGEKAFVAGADISEIAQLNKDTAREAAAKGQKVFSRIESSPKPVIAAVNGFALGGGCELAMACHIRVASENARFGQPEVNLGVIPGYGGTQRLTQLVGKGKAFELLMTGDMIDSREAHRLGLVNHVVAASELLNKCREILAKILTKAPLAIGELVDCVNAAVYLGEGYDVEAQGFANCTATHDFKEGTGAFLEKRKAIFQGK